MFESGFVAEVEGLLAAGYDPALPAMSGIGYTQVVQLLKGNLTRSEAIARAKTATHRLARQQSCLVSPRRSQDLLAGRARPPGCVTDHRS